MSRKVAVQTPAGRSTVVIHATFASQGEGRFGLGTGADPVMIVNGLPQGGGYTALFTVHLDRVQERRVHAIGQMMLVFPEGHNVMGAATSDIEASESGFESTLDIQVFSENVEIASLSSIG